MKTCSKAEDVKDGFQEVMALFRSSLFSSYVNVIQQTKTTALVIQLIQKMQINIIVSLQSPTQPTWVVTVTLPKLTVDMIKNKLAGMIVLLLFS